MAVDKDVIVVSDSSSSSVAPVFQTKIAGKTRLNHQLPITIVKHFNNLSVTGHSPNEATELAKEFCCSVVHTGCKKMSNVAVVEQYETAMTDNFKDSLVLDNNGNLNCTINVKENRHTLTLNHPH